MCYMMDNNYLLAHIGYILWITSCHTYGSWLTYRPISLLSVIAKTLEKSLLPYITANIRNTPTQHRYITQHSTVMALHTVNNTVAKGFDQIAPRAKTHCSTRYEQGFRHNNHTHTYQKAATDQHSRHNN